MSMSTYAEVMHVRGYILIHPPAPKDGTVFQWSLSLGERKELCNGAHRYVRCFRELRVSSHIARVFQCILAFHGLLGNRHVTGNNVCGIENDVCAPGQRMHLDFPSDTSAMKAEDIPLSALWAVSDTFWLHTKLGNIEVPKASMIVFRGDFPHAGCSGKIQSCRWRLHAYVQRTDAKFRPNVTYNLL